MRTLACFCTVKRDRRNCHTTALKELLGLICPELSRILRIHIQRTMKDFSSNGHKWNNVLVGKTFNRLGPAPVLHNKFGRSRHCDAKLFGFRQLALIVRRRRLGFFKVVNLEIVLFQQIVEIRTVLAGELGGLADVPFGRG